MAATEQMPERSTPLKSPPAPLAAKRTTWAWLVATFFGVGYLKPGPGTWGSVAATLLWMAVAYGLHPAPALLAIGTLAAALLALTIGILAAAIVERESGGRDPQHVVLDEVAGQWLALTPCAFALMAPLSRQPEGLLHVLLALALFRLFDITKPPPARNLEALHGGAGIMLDDIAAGLYAAIVLLVVQHWW